MELTQRVRIEDQEIIGPLTGTGIETIGDVINRVLSFFVPFVGVILTLTFVWAGYDLLTSGGNPEKVKNAKAKLTTAVIGVIILASSFLIARLAAYIFNLDTAGMF